MLVGVSVGDQSADRLNIEPHQTDGGHGAGWSEIAIIVAEGENDAKIANFGIADQEGSW